MGGMPPCWFLGDSLLNFRGVMKEMELRKHAECSICQQKIGHSGSPFFLRVTVERFLVDIKAMQRQDGLAAFWGNAKLASVMGVDENIANPAMKTVVLTVCESCSDDNFIVFSDYREDSERYVRDRGLEF
jgi:hypothetical protein